MECIYYIKFIIILISIGFSTYSYGQNLNLDTKLEESIKFSLDIESEQQLTDSLIKNLESIDLSLYDITDLDGIGNFKNLEYLSLQGNNISNITSLISLPNLKYLNLAQNQILDLSPLKYFYSLDFTINLDGNCINDWSILEENIIANIEIIGQANQLSDCNEKQKVDILSQFEASLDTLNNNTVIFTYTGWSNYAPIGILSFGDDISEMAECEGITRQSTHYYDTLKGRKAILRLNEEYLEIDLDLLLLSVELDYPQNEDTLTLSSEEFIWDLAIDTTLFYQVVITDLNDSILYSIVQLDTNYLAVDLTTFSCDQYSWKIRPYKNGTFGQWSSANNFFINRHDSTFINNYVCNVDSTGIKISKFVGINGCDSIVTINSIFPPELILALEDTITLKQNDTLLLTSNDSLQFQWSDNTSENYLVPLTTGKYFLTITNQDGCINKDSIYIQLIEDNCADIPFYLQAKVFLQGCFDKEMQLMHDKLRILDYLPHVEPYSTIVYNDQKIFEVINCEVQELAAPIVFTKTGEDAIVDWLFLELRNPLDSVVATRSALLQRDGDVVDVDGESPVAFLFKAGDYHLAIRHRNHLGVMTAAPISLQTGDTTSVDFTNASTPIYGENAQKSFNGMMAMWAGNSNFNSNIVYNGIANDRDPIFFDVFNDAQNTNYNYNHLSYGYYQTDLNMDGKVAYVGLNNDVDRFIFFNIFDHPANDQKLLNFIIQEQIPR